MVGAGLRFLSWGGAFLWWGVSLTGMGWSYRLCVRERLSFAHRFSSPRVLTASRSIPHMIDAVVGVGGLIAPLRAVGLRFGEAVGVGCLEWWLTLTLVLSSFSIMASFSRFAIEAFGADSAPWFDERIRQRMGTRSRLDPSREPPVSVLEGLVGKRRCSDILGDDPFDFTTWYHIDHHEDGSFRLRVRYPPAVDNELVTVAAVLMPVSANNKRESLAEGFIFNSKKEARHTAAFIFIVKLLDHADENPPARNWRNVLPAEEPVEEVAAEEAEAARAAEGELGQN